jgi:hypothetical protein
MSEREIVTCASISCHTFPFPLSCLSPMFCMLFLTFPQLARPCLTPVLPIHPQPPRHSLITLYRLALLMGRIEQESTAICDKVDSRSFLFTDICCSYSYAVIIIIISLSHYMNSSCNSIRNENYEVTNGSGNCNIFFVFWIIVLYHNRIYYMYCAPQEVVIGRRGL